MNTLPFRSGRRGTLGFLLGLLLASCAAPPPPAAKPAALPPKGAAEAPGEPAAPELSEPFVPKRVSFEQGAMGTRVTISAFTTPKLDEAAVKSAILEGFAEVPRLERLMSTWVDDSEISRINAAAGKSAVVVGPDTFAVIEKSLDIGAKSSGVFDISFEAMHGLWKFDENVDRSIPTLTEIRKAQRLIDYRKIGIDKAQQSVRLEKPGMRINLGGIAKGYAVDLVTKKLDEKGLPAFFVQAGGDLFVRGRKPDGSRFRVGIRDPRSTSATDYFAMIEVEDHAFSTAGDYERSFIVKGKRYHHIIDPRTGYPATASRSVTVWAKSAFVADALDDAIFILGPDKGLPLLDGEDDAGAVVVSGDNKVTISPRLKDVVMVLRDPTDGV